MDQSSQTGSVAYLCLVQCLEWLLLIPSIAVQCTVCTSAQCGPRTAGGALSELSFVCSTLLYSYRYNLAKIMD